MRHIDIEELANLPEIHAFEKIADDYLNQLVNMTPEERKNFIKDHTDWNSLQKVCISV